MNMIIPHYINGQPVISEGNIIDVFNPATGLAIAQLGCGNSKIIDQAVRHALDAQSDWAQVPPLKRAKIFRDFAHHLESNINELAQTVTLEHGKTLDDAKASIQRGLEIVQYHCDIQHQLQGSFSHHVSQNVHTTTLYQPLGVCAGVAPFNFPVMVPLWMLMPAIACGNAFILKPSEKTPSATLKLIEWLELCGLPKGVAQCIQGDANTVQCLLENPDIQAITAVGSTKAAHHIYSQACQFGKRSATFGGAKNHAVVMPDANMKHAADAIVTAAFGSAGQRCMALSAVIMVGDDTANQLIPLLIERIQNIKIGPGTESNIDMGPVISSQQLYFLKEAIAQGIEEGASLICDGRNTKLPNSTGFFIGPSLFDHVTPQMAIYKKELFGPILILIRSPSLDEALDCINQNPYGNGSVIFTESGYLSQQFIDRVQAGMVGVNIPVPVPIVSHPFGGWKQSSFGSHPMHGLDSIRFYTHQKSITTTWPKLPDRQTFTMPHL